MAEGNPLADDSTLAAPLAAVTRLVLRSPGLVVGGAVMLAVLAVLVSVNGLSFKTSRLDLLNPRSEYNQRWLAYLSEFGDRDDAVCVVRSDNPAVLAAAIDDLAAALTRRPELFESIFYRRDLSALKRKALHFVPDDELAKLEQQVRHATAMIPREGQSADPASALAQLNDRLAHIGTANPEIHRALDAEYQRIAGMTLAALASGPPASATAGLPSSAAGSALVFEAAASPSPAAPSQISPISPDQLAAFDSQYILADNGRLGFVLLKLKVDDAEFARGAKAIRELRRAIAQVRQRHPAAWIGLTGMPVIEFDEMQASQTDMIWTSVVSMVAVFGLFIAGYGGLRHSLLANLVLLLATAYSFGFVTLAVGHLNILSAAFSAVLIGLGIDFGIHYLACYLKIRSEGLGEEAALIRTSIEVGPGMFTGGVTTSAAFFMAAMTDFLGIRELGLIAGGSILLCVAATVVVLPPLVLIVDRHWPIGAVPRIVPAGRWFAFTSRWPRPVMAMSLVVTLAAATGLGWMRYDHNLLNLQPKHLESADIERELFTKLEDSVWFAVTICDSRADLLAKKAQFEGLGAVAKTEEIGSLLPASSVAKQQLVTAIGQHLAMLPPQAPAHVPIDPRRLKAELTRARELLARETPLATPALALVDQLAGALAQMPDEALAAQLTAAQSALVQQSFAHLATLRNLADPVPPQLADLPRELTDRFVGRHQTLLLKVYARGNVWDMDRLAAFVHDVESVDPRITGHPVQTYYASRHMQQSYILSGIYALIAVLVLLWIDLRSLTHSLLAMAPLAMGFVQMCGLFGWCGIPFNAANMIVLPVILGIGVDHGVHLVHAWRQQRGRFVLADSTAVAVLLTATTTTASFGILILARHQGLQSLGQVLTIGVTTCLFSSIVFFPALLRLLTANRAEPVRAPAEPLPIREGEALASNNSAEPPALLGKPAVAPAELQPAGQVFTLPCSVADSEPAPQGIGRLSTNPTRIDPPAPAVPRRRALPAADEADNAPSRSPHDAVSPLRHLAAVRESER
jgi:hopanoid biosynthesis associated RND transporter like protein HpnN